jgi:hypothetical protein
VVRALRGFLIDLLLSGVASALGWHPVYAFFVAHSNTLYWSVGGVHIAFVSFVVVQAVFGNTRGADLIEKTQGKAHERLYVWSMVGTTCTSFIVPFACPLVFASGINMGFSMAVLFAPFAALMGTFSMALIPSMRKRDIKIWSPFASVGGRIVIGALSTVYLALLEATMFLCIESSSQAKDVMVVAGLFLSYLPVRLFLFYNVTASEERAEVASIFASFCFVGVQLAI